MSAIKRIETSERMSKIVIHNRTVYLCGQVGHSSDDPVSIGCQTENMLARVDALLAEAGSSRNSILSATIYLRDMKDFAEMNKVWDRWTPEGHAPARACVEARMARPDLLVEISVIAALEE
ncbi:RidA family protein [Desulfosediminicola ganghwensis]|uniref:RidA family protein n=1 Tax=Desulfosediminicola ganghwensis TaxID=2569540 RepID=UPI0010AC5673|nr:RidA family protein [Desulfosediminicola ganghwensis]